MRNVCPTARHPRPGSVRPREGEPNAGAHSTRFHYSWAYKGTQKRQRSGPGRVCSRRRYGDLVSAIHNGRPQRQGWVMTSMKITHPLPTPPLPKKTQEGLAKDTCSGLPGVSFYCRSCVRAHIYFPPAVWLAIASSTGGFADDTKKTPGPGTYNSSLANKRQSPAYSLTARTYMPGGTAHERHSCMA